MRYARARPDPREIPGNPYEHLPNTAPPEQGETLSPNIETGLLEWISSGLRKLLCCENRHSSKTTPGVYQMKRKMVPYWIAISPRRLNTAATFTPEDEWNTGWLETKIFQTAYDLEADVKEALPDVHDDQETSSEGNSLLSDEALSCEGVWNIFKDEYFVQNGANWVRHNFSDNPTILSTDNFLDELHEKVGKDGWIRIRCDRRDPAFYLFAAVLQSVETKKYGDGASTVYVSRASLPKGWDWILAPRPYEPRY